MSANLFRKASEHIPLHWLKHFSKLYLPFSGAGIKIEYLNPEIDEIHISLAYKWWNKNYVGTQFGGSMFAMTDPWYMMILMHQLGRDYIVWDKAARIEFKRPGREKLFAKFHVSPEEVQSVRDQAETQGKTLIEKEVDITNGEGEVIASVVRTIYIRKKNSKD